MSATWAAVGGVVAFLLQVARAGAAPPHLVADLAPGAADAGIDTLRAAGSSVVFRRGGADLWGSDGTSAGTLQLRSGPIANLTQHDGRVAFTAPAATAPFEDLWLTDATSGGTQLVTTLSGAGTCPVFESCSPVRPVLDNFTSVGGLLYFRKDAFGVWRSDGTPDGTFQAGFYGARVCSTACLCCFYLGAELSLFTGVNQQLYFDQHNSFTFEVSIERSDGATSQTALSNIGASAMGAANGRLFFTSPDGLSTALWVLDGNGVRNLGAVGEGTATVTQLTAAAGLLYFVVAPGTANAALWRSDGTVLGTFAILPADVSDLTPYAGGVAFRRLDPAGDELWRSDGTAAGTSLVSALAPTDIAAVGATLFFAAADATGAELWASDGTPAGTQQVADLVPGPAGSAPADLTAACGRLYFTAATPDAGRELWVLDVDPGNCPTAPASDCQTDAQCAQPCGTGHCDAQTGCSVIDYPCCGDASCDDADPCTADSCGGAAGCSHVLPPGLQAITCVLGASGSETALCPGETFSTAIDRRLDRVRSRLTQAAGRTDPDQASRCVSAAVRALDLARRRIDRELARARISGGCHAALTEMTDTARARAVAWQP